MSFDYIIVGAGITGITAAEELANLLDKKVLLIDKRDHIGGNCYDFVNENGNIIHKYGPHVFHTDNLIVYNYLSLFTRWNSYSHKILYNIDDNLIPVPFNFISIDKILPNVSEEIKVALLDNFDINSKIPIKTLKSSDNKYLKMLGDKIYDIFSETFKKIYGLKDSEIEEYVEKMYPFRMSYDCRYFHNLYQVIPANGYTSMFNNMLSNHNITIMLNKDYHEILKIDHEKNKIYYEDEEFKGHLIFTGMIDEFFEYKYGELRYSSLIIENESIDNSTFQDNAIICFPDKYHFSRITDYKYITGEYSTTTAIQFEFPVKYDKNNEEQNIPYYPIDLNNDRILYNKYKELTTNYENVTFIGRLAEYKLLQMDECIEKVLNIIGKIKD